MRKKRYRHRDKLKLMHNCIKHYKEFQKSFCKLDRKIRREYVRKYLNGIYGASFNFGNVLFADTDSVKVSDFNKQET